jgi:alpha-amylase
MEYFLKRLCLYVLGTVMNISSWWDNGDYQIAFCRGAKGFIAFNDQYNTDLNVNLQVNLKRIGRLYP